MGKTDRLSKRIQRIAAEIILYELKDPRVKNATVTRVELTPDYQYCTIYVSVLGTPAQQRTTMKGLEHARGYIQRQVASRLSLRHAPILRIVLDKSIEKSFEIYKKLEEIKKEREDATQNHEEEILEEDDKE